MEALPRAGAARVVSLRKLSQASGAYTLWAPLWPHDFYILGSSIIPGLEYPPCERFIPSAHTCLALPFLVPPPTSLNQMDDGGRGQRSTYPLSTFPESGPFQPFDLRKYVWMWQLLKPEGVLFSDQGCLLPWLAYLTSYNACIPRDSLRWHQPICCSTHIPACSSLKAFVLFLLEHSSRG